MHPDLRVSIHFQVIYIIILLFATYYLHSTLKYECEILGMEEKKNRAVKVCPSGVQKDATDKEFTKLHI